MMRLPKILIYLRLLAGLLLLCFSLIHLSTYRSIAVGLITFGFLSDIFDGIAARRLNIPSQKLSRLDSATDEVFWLSVAAATYVQCKGFFLSNSIQIVLLLASESLTYIVCFVKFRKEVATHSIGSKAWTLFLFATVIQVVLTCNSSGLFQICFYFGILTRLENIGIILLLKTWTSNVPSLYHAILLRKRTPLSDVTF